MSSLTDIIFLLLIFFMLTSSFVSPNGIKLFFPKATSSPAQEPKKVYVKLSIAGDLYVDNKRTDIEQLEQTLRSKINEQDAIILASNNKTKYGAFVKVLNICNRVTKNVVISKNQKLEAL